MHNGTGNQVSARDSVLNDESAKKSGAEKWILRKLHAALSNDDLLPL